MQKIISTLKHPKMLAGGLVVLLISNAATLGLFLQSQANPNSTNPYPFIDIARNYIKQEHFIVNIQPLREQLQQLVRQEGSDNISIYFEFLNTGANIQINNEVRFYPASLVKLPSAMVAMRKVEKGQWDMDSRLVLFDQDRDDRYGDLYKQPVGTSFSIAELLKALLIQSDNTAHKILMRNLSIEELGELQDAIGLQDLYNERREVSAKEYSRLFRALYNSSFLSRQDSQQILTWLNQTEFKNSLAAGLPASATFAHKIGEDNVEQNYLDSGIVYLPNRPYLLSVMIKQHDKAQAETLMKRISQAAHDYVVGYE